MGVYIKRMEMPKSCSECFMNFCDGRKTVVHFAVERSADCPLVPVPPHGRLIDADAARESIKPWSPEDERSGYTFKTVKKAMHAMLYRAPTIIPAEEGE